MIFFSHANQQNLFNKAEWQLLAQLSVVKTKHAQRFNAGQPAVTLPLELLTHSLSFLDANDQISTARVCQHWRKVVCSTPALWTRINGIEHMSRFSLSLSRAQNVPIDITSMRIASTEDPKLLLLSRHLHHIQMLELELSSSFETIRRSSAAFGLFTTAAPLLKRITFTSATNFSWKVGAVDKIFAGCAPLLRTFELHGINAAEFTRSLRDIQSIQSISLRYTGISPMLVEETAHGFDNLATLNVELQSWVRASSTSSSFVSSLRRLNIRWTGTTAINPSSVIPQRDFWKLVPAIHVMHALHSDDAAPTIGQSVPAASILATATPYTMVTVRSFGAPKPRMHVRAVDVDDRERVFCGLVPWSLSGMLARIPADQVSILGIGTSAAGVGFLTEARCPAVRAIRLILDTTDLAWVVVFARDILNFTALERLEFTIERTVPGTDWSTAVIMRILGSCLASGSTLLQVAFKGFSPDPGCLTQLGAFAREVVVEPEWVEPDNERRWFTHPCFDWL